MPEPEYEQLFTIGPFGGLELTTDPEYVAIQNAASVSNYDPSRVYGALTSGYGRSANVTVDTFSFPISALAILPVVAANNPTKTHVLAYMLDGSGHGQFQLASVGGGGIVSPAAIATLLGTDCAFASYGHYVFASPNGAGAGNGDTPIKIDLSGALALELWQIAPGMTQPGAATGAAGLLNGTYVWCYTYSYQVGTENHESSPSPVSTQVTCTNQTANLTAPSSTDPKVTSVNFYRLGGTSATAAGLWTQVGTVANGTGVISFTDNISDANLTGATLILHRDPPPNFNSVCTHKNRMWGFGYNYPYPYTFGPNNAYVATNAAPTDIWFSRYAEPWAFDCVNNVIPVGIGSQDRGVSIVSLGSVLVYHTQQLFGVVEGSSEQDFQAITIANIGCANAHTVAVGYGICFWVSPDGIVWLFDGSSPRDISTGGIGKSNIAKALEAGVASNFQGWRSAVYDSFYYLISPAGVTYAYYILGGVWTEYAWTSTVATADPNVPLFIAVAPNYPNIIDEWLGREGDSYGPYTTIWTSGEIVAPGMETRKEYRFAILRIPPSDPGNTVQVTFYVDGVQVYTKTVSPRAAGALPGIGKSYYRLSFPPGTKGHVMVVSITMTEGPHNVPVSLSSISVYGTVVEKFPPGIDES